MENKKQQIPNRVYDELKNDILNMKIKPGSILSEIETAKKFNVSRTPVRDAFRRLEGEGLLEVRPHIGTFVTLIDLDTISDIIYIREKVEIGIVENLAESLPQSQLFNLRIILLKQRELLSKEEENLELALEFIQLDNEFHYKLFELAGKKGVWDLLNQQQHHYLRFRVFIDLSNKDRLQDLLETHEKILECIEKKELSSMREIYQHHLYEGVKNATPKIYDNPSYFKYLANS